jgi:hypothetical protein
MASNENEERFKSVSIHNTISSLYSFQVSLDWKKKAVFIYQIFVISWESDWLIKETKVPGETLYLQSDKLAEI